MTRIVWIGLALLSAWLYAPVLAQAQTCEPRTNVPSYEVGKPAPIICDEHGSQHVKIVDADGNFIPEAVATEAAPTLPEGSRASLSLDLAGNLRITPGTQAGGEHIGASEDEGYQRTVGGPARSYSLMTDVTTDTSSATTALPAGSKTFFAKIVGSAGAQSVTVTIYGDYKSTATEEFPICTLSTLSGTSEDAKKCTAISDDYDYYHAKTTSISGTDATVNVWAMVGIGGALNMAGSVRRDVAASSAGTTGDNATLNTSALGLLWTRNLDPCSGIAKVFVPISIGSATTTELINGAGASTRVYICSLVLHTDAANDVAVVEDDTDACATPTGGLFGGATAATGFQFPAGGGVVIGNGQGTMAKTSVDNYYVCIITSAATQLTGTLGYALAP